eukprot:tig00000113_g5604.t1
MAGVLPGNTGRRMRYAISGETRLTGATLRATLYSEHRNQQTDEVFFVGGAARVSSGSDSRIMRSQSKRVTLRVEIDFDPEVGKNAPTPPPSLLCEMLDPSGEPLDTFSVKQQNQDRDVVPFQRWMGADNFNGGPVVIEVSARPGRGWSSGDLDCRIVPLSRRVGGNLGLRLRSEDPDPAFAPWTVTITGILTVARHDWGTGKRMRGGQSQRDLDPEARESRRHRGDPHGEILALPEPPAPGPDRVCIEQLYPDRDRDEPVIQYVFLVRSYFPANHRAYLQAVLSQARAPAPAPAFRAPSGIEPASPQTQSARTKDLTVAGALVPAAAAAAPLTMLTPRTLIAEPLEDGLYCQTFDVCMPEGAYALHLTANGAPPENLHARVVFCTASIESPAPGGAPIAGSRVDFRFAANRAEDVAGFSFRLYLSDGRVFDVASEGGRGALAVDFERGGAFWAKAAERRSCLRACPFHAPSSSRAFPFSAPTPLPTTSGVASPRLDFTVLGEPGAPPLDLPDVAEIATFSLDELLCAPSLVLSSAPSTRSVLRSAASARSRPGLGRAVSARCAAQGDALLSAAANGDAEMILLLLDAVEREGGAAARDLERLARAARAAAEGGTPWPSARSWSAGRPRKAPATRGPPTSTLRSQPPPSTIIVQVQAPPPLPPKEEGGEG